MNRVKAARVAEVVELRKKRLTYARISQLTGVPISSVRLWCIQQEIDKPRARFPECLSKDPLVQHIHKLVLSSGMTATEFAYRIGYSQNTVLRMFRGDRSMRLHVIQNSLQLFGLSLTWTNTHKPQSPSNIQPGLPSSSRSGIVGQSLTPSDA